MSRRRIGVRRLVLVAGLALLAVSCRASHHPSAAAPSTTSGRSPASATVRGGCNPGGATAPVEVTLRLVGGRPPGLDKPVAGTVVAVGASGERCTVTVGNKFAARVDLAPGVYTITGRSPAFGDGKYECAAPRPVTIAARPPNSHGGPVLVDVVCPVR